MFSALTGGAPTGAHGIFEGGDLLVSEKSGTPDMSVDVAEGACMIAGDEATYQGSYFAENRGVTNLAISAADATNARKDLVVAKVEDSDYSGATDAWSLAVVTGTPAGSPSEPTVPDNAIVLALVDVPALDTAITDSQITDRRVITQEGRMANGITPTTSAARPSSPYAGMMIYETDTLRTRQWDGTYWLEIHGPIVDWTPSIQGGLTLGNGTLEGKYFLKGWELHWWISLTWGSTTSATNPQFNTPGTMTIDGDATAFYVGGTVVARESGVGWYNGTAVAYDAADDILNTATFFSDTDISATVPFTWGTADRLILSGVYPMDDVDAPTS